MSPSTMLRTGRKPLVIANWKMQIRSPAEAKQLSGTLRKRARSFAGVEVWLAPAYPLISTTAAALKGSSIRVGTQAVSPFDPERGTHHTGEVSAILLKNCGASFAIVGHSERRALGESDNQVHDQLRAATAKGLTAVLCVGEHERDTAGGHFAFIEGQLRSALHDAVSFAARSTSLRASKVILAYEPVWAIGKHADAAMKPQELEEMVIFIRKTLAELLGRPTALKVPILYGGSVEPDNAKTLLSEGGVQGLLVGHASTEVGSFVDILKVLRGLGMHKKLHAGN